jgi:hypothetical protein
LSRVIDLIAHPWRGARRRRFFALTIGALVAFALAPTPRCYADDASADALQLSDRAFAMLNSINATASANKPGPILEPVASLAGDAQTLSTALNTHDDAAAHSAMAAVLSDRDRIEAAAKIAGGAVPEEWVSIREKIAALEKAVPVAKGSIEARGTSSMRASSATASAPPPAGEAMPAAPQVAIGSRVFKGDAVRIKGYLEGTDLKSAGIFDGDQKTKDIDVASTPGDQRINFDFSIEQPSPSQSIRVTDAYGREASAMVSPDQAGVGAMKGDEELIEVEPAANASSGVATGPEPEGAEPEIPESGDRLASAGPDVHNNTAEIPSSTDALSPSRRHIEAGSSLAPLTNVEINVIDSEELMSQPGMVEVVGQIAGPGVRHAGVYINGQLIKSIPISTVQVSAFDVTFPMPAGSDARIRAYGNGNNFVEASIDSVGTGTGINAYGNAPVYVYPTSPYYRPNPYAYANPYAPGYNPYAPNPYGYPPGYGPPPYGTPYYGTTPPPNKPWYNKLLP